MKRWRFIVTYTGIVEAADEDEAIEAAYDEVGLGAAEDCEVEEIPSD